MCAAFTDTSAFGNLHLDDLRLSNSERFSTKRSKTLTRSKRLIAVDVYHGFGQIFSLESFCLLASDLVLSFLVARILKEAWSRPWMDPGWSLILSPGLPANGRECVR